MRRFPRCFAWLLLLSACGAGTSTGSEPKSPAGDADDRQRHGEGATADSEEGDASEASSAPEKSKGPSCDDGTCSLCGSGICPAGWYCDEKASACSWLTECAEKPSCGCVTRVLGSSCKCHEEKGGLKVACD